MELYKTERTNTGSNGRAIV